MSMIYGPPVPAGSAQEPPRSPGTPPGGPGGEGGRWNQPRGPARRPRHRRGLVITAAGAALVAAAALGTAWGLQPTHATRPPTGAARG